MFNLSLVENNTHIVQVHGEFYSSNLELCTDSRFFSNGQAFLAIAGVRFDAFKFYEDVLAKGCPLFIYDFSKEKCEKIEKIKKRYEKTVFVAVDNSVEFVQELAIARRKQWVDLGGTIIGITGSNGKTTTKEMLFRLASNAFPGRVHATKGNLNNHLGVPYTILDLKNEHSLAIIEMGTNHPGEIEKLCEMASPKHGLITSIGHAHMEFFEKIENVFEEKSSLYRFVKKNGSDKSRFVINGLDEQLNKLESFEGCIRLGDDVTFEVNDSYEVTIRDNGEVLTIKNESIREAYNFQNLVLAFSLLRGIYPEFSQDFLDAASSYKIPSLNRSEWIMKEGKTIFLDAYNANPTSMKAALHSFTSFLKREGVDFSRALFVLGDMNELGPLAKQMHKDIALECVNLGIRNIVFVGRYASFYGEGYNSNSAEICEEKEELEKLWPKLKSRFDYFFFKASRSLQLESIIDIR